MVKSEVPSQLFYNTLENNPSKIAALSFSIISSILLTPLLFSIIEFERDHHNRTLINQLISCLMWGGIIWNLVMQPVTCVRYFIGPIDSQIICGLDTILRNVISMYALLMFDLIIILLLKLHNSKTSSNL